MIEKAPVASYNVNQNVKLALSSLLAVLAFGCAHAPVDPPALIRSGYAHAMKGDAAKAKEDFEKALAVEPNPPGARVSYGWALFNLGRFEEALQQWKRVHDGVDRRAPNIEVCLALGCFKVGKKAEALDWYAKQVARDERFDDQQLVDFATSHWTAKEKEALAALFQEYSRQGRKPISAPEPKAVAR